MGYGVIEARHVAGYVIWLRFRDDTAGEIDLEKELILLSDDSGRFPLNSRSF